MRGSAAAGRKQGEQNERGLHVGHNLSLGVGEGERSAQRDSGGDEEMGIIIETHKVVGVGSFAVKVLDGGLEGHGEVVVTGAEELQHAFVEAAVQSI